MRGASQKRGLSLTFDFSVLFSQIPSIVHVCFHCSIRRPRLIDGNVVPLVFRLMRAHLLHDDALHHIFTLVFLLMQHPPLELEVMRFLLAEAPEPVRAHPIKSLSANGMGRGAAASVASDSAAGSTGADPVAHSLSPLAAASSASASSSSSSAASSSSSASSASPPSPSSKRPVRPPRTVAEREAAWAAAEALEDAAEDAAESEARTPNAALPLTNRWRLRIRVMRHKREDEQARQRGDSGASITADGKQAAMTTANAIDATAPAWYDRELFEPSLCFLVDLLHTYSSRIVADEVPEYDCRAMGAQGDGESATTEAARLKLLQMKRRQVATDALTLLSMCANSTRNAARGVDPKLVAATSDLAKQIAQARESLSRVFISKYLLLYRHISSFRRLACFSLLHVTCCISITARI
jgi:hypothetical protein